MKIRTKLILSALIPISFLAISTAVQIHVESLVDRHQHRGLLLGELSRGLAALDILVLEHRLQSPERAHVQWTEKYRQLKSDLDALRNSAADEKERLVLERLRIGYTLLGSLDNEYDTALERLRRGGESSIAIQSYAHRLESRLRQELQVLTPEVERLYSINADKIRQLDSRRDHTHLLLLILMGIFAPGFACLLYRAVALPIARLSEGINRVAAGDLSFRLADTGRDEIGQASAHFNEMAEQRMQAEETIRTMNQELERRVEERTRELEAMARELQHSEEKYRIVSENSLDWVFWLDPEGGFVYCSPSCLEVTGHNDAEFYADAGLLLRIAHPDDRDMVREHRHDVLQEGVNDGSMIFRIVRPDGAIRWLEHVCQPIIDRGGKFIGNRGSNRDISERIRIEKALEEKEQKFRALADLLPQMVFEIDIKGNFTYANRYAFEVSGYTLDDFDKGLNAMQMFVPEDLDRVRENILRRLRGEELGGVEYTAIRRDGSRFPVILFANPILHDNEVAGLRGIVVDITERKRIEEELGESRQQLANIIDFLPDATFVIDGKKRVIAWNRAMEEMSGVSKGEMLGQGDHAYTVPFYGERRQQLLDLLDVSDAELESRYQNVQRKGEVLNAEMFATALYGGRGAYLWASGAPLYSTDNRRVGSIEIIRDISDRKKVEDELQQAKLAAEAASRAKSEFLANMSHEIRTPMNAITGMAYLVQHTELDSRQREYVGRIKSASDSLLGIINEILDFSKIEAGKMELESVAFELKDILNSVHNLVSAKAEDKNLEIKFTIDPEVPAMLIGDQLRLRQILNNLVSNAIKFTEKGEIVISIASCGESSQVDCTALTFSVADTGIGLSKENLERIYQPFTQADSSITRKYGGTGLGLSIVVRLLEMMGSRLEIVSEPGLGSTFSFTVKFGLIHDQLPLPQQTPEDLKGMRVLVVDDSTDALQLLDSMLKALKFRTTLVESGTAALGELARVASDPDESPYRLVLLDCRMPEMDGVETARRIRDECHLSPAPEIIIISGYISTQVQKEANDIGVRVFLNKPLVSATLLNGIMKALGRESTPQTPGSNHAQPQAVGIKQLRDIRVLLVEDDRVNQIVAQEILKQFGAEVTTVGNGRDGIEAVLNGPAYDMVFMDIQMPGMNGYEATAAIREVKGDLELPIIAMTAHAFSEERDRCLAAGMNDHIAKPIDPAQLYSLVLKWLPPEKICSCSPLREIVDDGMALQPFPDSLPGIEVASVLKRCGGNKTLAREIIISFRQQSRNIGNEIHAAVESGNIEQAKLLVHNIKGVSGNIGADSLFATIAKLETNLNNGDLNLQPLLATMDQHLADIFEAANILEKTSAPQADDSTFIRLPPDELEPLLKELRESLQNNSLSAKNLYEPLKHHIQMPEREEIRKHIARLEFGKALNILSAYCIKQLSLL